MNKGTFNAIYEYNIWLTGSGTGSVPSWNKPYMEFIQNFLGTHPQITSVVDLGCGDWQIGSKIDWGDRKYLGCDVSDYVLNKTKEKYGSEQFHFQQLDVVDDPLPDADLVIIKDVLQHLSTKDTEKVLEKLDKYSYAVVQNDVYENQQENKDIRNGSFRPLDITLAPFKRTEYSRILEYTESARKPFNILRRLLLKKPVRKGIFVREK